MGKGAALKKFKTIGIPPHDLMAGKFLSII